MEDILSFESKELLNSGFKNDDSPPTSGLSDRMDTSHEIMSEIQMDEEETAKYNLES